MRRADMNLTPRESRNSAVEGHSWSAGAKRGTFTKPKKGIHVSGGRLSSLEFTPPGADAVMRFSTTNDISYLIQDSRQWEDEYTLRIGRLGACTFAKDDVFFFSVFLSSDGIKTVYQKPYVVKAGAEWIPIDYHRDIEAGSALDFSGMEFTDATAGRINAGALCADVKGAPATVWVSSLDGSAIRESKRLLLTHVTDVQGEGAKYADEQMKTTLKWGRRPLVRNGRAEISLAVDDPDRYVVYSLSTSGRRLGKVPTSVCDGRLCFVAEVASPEGARILYEIVSGTRL